ncbi:MAG TPA: hypothetical protein VK253_01980 [Candidatus Binatia bacterium]|nr:hypothetical protein [Candidatus Binatia bacterium]
MTMTLMNSREAFLATALLLVVVSCFSAVVYAQVTVDSSTPLKGTVTYSLTNAESETWTTTLAPTGPQASWYSRLEINGGSYIGPVTVTWKLQQKVSLSSWMDVSAISTSTELTGNRQILYATHDGAHTQSNYNWGQNIITSGTYRVVATVTA